MRKTILLVIGGLLVAAPHLTLAQAPPQAGQELVGSGELDSVVRVRDILVGSTEISGTIVNLTDDELRDVRLRVRDMFLWRNERRPGEDDFSRAEEFVVRGPVPPRGALAFTAPRSPLAPRSDGEYRTSVDVTSLTRQSVTAQAPSTPPPVGSPPPAGSTSPPAEGSSGAAAPGVVVVPPIGGTPPAGSAAGVGSEPTY
jgi:hypothetical protein